MPNNPLVTEASRLFELHTGKKIECKRSYMCKCFSCQLDSFAVDYDRALVGDTSCLENKMASVRDELAPIVAGVIPRQHCVGSAEAYGGKRGVRKTMLKDAVSIASNCVARINNAITAYHDDVSSTQIEFMKRANGESDE